MLKRFTLFLRYLQNNRMCDYELAIQKAIEAGYRVISLRDYCDGHYAEEEKLLILRHDVDHRSKAVELMFEAEKKYGVHASYYFRNCTFDALMMKRIEAYGSEASLHFEPIADFVKANPDIRTKEDLFATDFQARCLKVLKADIERYRALLDIPCDTIASHGERENVRVETPNNFLTEDTACYQELGIKLEAYNKAFIEKVTCYISDVPMEINGGYRYGTSPVEAVLAGEKCILFLSHPNHWHYTVWQRIRKLVKVLVTKPFQANEGFKRI